MPTNNIDGVKQNIRQLEVILHLITALRRVAIVGHQVATGKMSNERGWEAIAMIVEETEQDIPEIN